MAAISPTTGIVTTMVTMTGSNFGATQGTATVTFGATVATVQSWSDTSITLAVPDVHPSVANVTVTTPGGTTAPEMFTVVLPSMVYVNNNETDPTSMFNTVTAMTFSPTTGALVQLGMPVSLGVTASGFGGCDSSIAVDVPGRRLFASGSTGVAVLDIDPVTGALTAIAGSPFISGGTTGEGLALNAGGTRVWLASYDTKIAVWDVGATGTLTAVAGSPFTSAAVDGIVVSANESFVYANSEDNTFSAFASSTAGALTGIVGSPFAGGAYAYSFARRTGHDQIYIPNANGLAVWQPNVAGTPVQIAGSPFVAGKGGSSPATGTSFTPDGNRVYLGAFGSATIIGLNLAADGTPTVIPGGPFTSTLASASCTAVSRDGAHLIVLDSGSKRVGVFNLSSTGVPTAVVGSPFTTTTPAEDASGLAITF